VTWDEALAAWWLEEVATDPGYERDVDPLLSAVLPADRGGLLLDVGCGQGRSLGRYGKTVGLELLPTLAAVAARKGPVVQADLVQPLPFGDGSFAGAYVVLVLEHLLDPVPLAKELARVVQKGGWCALVHNHPVLTAPESGPVVDTGDGEVMWRWGDYLGKGWTDEPAGDGSVRFHHRTLGDLLGMFASAGWSLEELREAPAGDPDDPLLQAQRSIPRLIAMRWRNGVVPAQAGAV
jgi:SAM-dependent methyltransferase